MSVPTAAMFPSRMAAQCGDGERCLECTPVMRHGNSGTGCFKVSSAIACRST